MKIEDILKEVNVDLLGLSCLKCGIIYTKGSRISLFIYDDSVASLTPYVISEATYGYKTTEFKDVKDAIKSYINMHKYMLPKSLENRIANLTKVIEENNSIIQKSQNKIDKSNKKLIALKYKLTLC